MRARFGVAAGALALAVAAAGCGGSDTSKPKTSGSKATVVPQVSQVPRQGNAPGTTAPHGDAALRRLPPAPKPRGPAPRITGVEGVPTPQALDTVGNDVATFWLRQFNQAKLKFDPAKQAIITTGFVESSCGQNPPVRIDTNSDTGPFYCSTDNTVFLPVGIFDKIIAPIGDAATAFTVAHEWGHRVEDQLGLFSDPRYQQGPALELTADCLGGVWLASEFQRNALDPSDIQEAMSFLSKIGDNPGAPPSADPHGTSAQRIASFRSGYADGRAGDCTFKAIQAIEQS
jgi:predicted metalloprotease